jgi:hypothetical protein
LGNAGGTFRPPVQYTTNGIGSSITVGDFNGDHKLDLAVASTSCPPADVVCGSGSVWILLGNGDGTFQAPVGYSTGFDTLPDSVRVGDFNGDGKLDLAVANYNCTGSPPTCGQGSVSILLGNGDGTFQSPIESNTDTGPGSVRVGDFNGDGKLDVVVVAGTDTVSVLLGKGDRTFQPYVDYATGSGLAAVVVGDFNGDNKLDLATANTSNTVSILLGNGDGTFQAHVEYPAGADEGRVPVGLRVGDFNGDGKLDLVVGNSDTEFPAGSVSILLGKGDGTFPTHVEYATAFGAVELGAESVTTAISTAMGNWTSSSLTKSTVVVNPRSRSCWAGATVPFWTGPAMPRALIRNRSPRPTRATTPSPFC